MPSWLSPEWLCGNSYTWAHDVRLHILGTNESKSVQRAKRRASYRWSWVIHNAQSAQISQKQDGRNKYEIMKTICSPGYYHNGFVASHALGHTIYCYTFLLPVNQRMLNKLHKERNKSGPKWSRPHRVLMGA